MSLRDLLRRLGDFRPVESRLVAPRTVHRRWIRGADHSLHAAFAAFLSIGAVAYLSELFRVPLLIIPLASSAILIAFDSRSPMARARSVLGGHVISAAVGVACLYAVGLIVDEEWWALALSVAAAGVAMHMAGMMHAPAGATALMASVYREPASFIGLAGIGAAIVVGFGWVGLYMAEVAERSTEATTLFSRAAGGRQRLDGDSRAARSGHSTRRL